MALLDAVDNELAQRGYDPEAVGAVLGRNPKARNARLGVQPPTSDFLLANMRGGRYTLETPETARERLEGSALQSPLGQSRTLAPTNESAATSTALAPRSATGVSPILGSIKSGQTTAFGDAQPSATLGNEPKAPIQPLGMAERYKTLEPERPDKSRFPEHVGLGRKILGTLATIGAGYYGASVHDPALAGRVAERMFHPQYSRAMDEYNTRLGDIANEAKLGQTEAETNLANARSYDLLHPQPKLGTQPKIAYHYTNDKGQEVSVYEDGTEKIGSAVQHQLAQTAPHTTDFGGFHWQYDPEGKLPGTRRGNWVRLGPSNRQGRESGDELTPAQKLARTRLRNQYEREKNEGLSRAEDDIRKRYGLTGFAASEAWPQQAIDELKSAKQNVQDEYESKLGNLGDEVTHFDYRAQRNAGGANQPGAQAGGKTLDRNNPDDRQVAADILREAGGDVNKARQLARQRGYKF